MTKLVAVPIVFFAFVAACSTCAAQNQVLELLTKRGVEVGPNEVVRLPLPTMGDGLDEEGQRRAGETITDGGHSWADLTRKSVVAPFILRISKEEEGQPQVGRRLDLWFVAYGDLKKLGNTEFLEKQFKSAGSETDPENGSSAKTLSDAELEARGLAAPRRLGDSEYVAVEFTLLDRVRLKVTSRSTRTQTDDSMISASILDRRFDSDAAYRNQWRPILRDDAGRRSLGEPQAYYGYGSYAKATRLVSPPGAIFIEYHAAFAEPQGWFSGTNLLRSKMPILAQLIVRQLRRGLAK